MSLHPSIFHDEVFLKKEVFLNKAATFHQPTTKEETYLSILTATNAKPLQRLCYMALCKPLKDALQSLGPGMAIGSIINLLGPEKVDLLPFLRILYINDYLLERGAPSLSQPLKTRRSLGISVTNSCNLRCVYCYAAAGDAKPQNLSLNHGFSGIDYFFNQLPSNTARVQLVFIGGGEPTHVFPLTKSFYERFKARAKERGLAMIAGLVTNGNFSREILSYIVEEQIGVTVSIDGPPSIHDQLRPRADGYGSFQQAMKNLEQLALAGLRVTLRSTITPLNEGIVLDLVQMGHDYGAFMVHLQQCQGSGRKNVDGQAYKPDHQLVNQLLKAFFLGLDLGIHVKVGYLRSLMPGTGRYCGGDRESMHLSVTPSGAISSCAEVNCKEDPGAEAFLYGHIGDAGAIHIDEEKAKALASRRADRIQECRDCFLAPNCAGGCPLQAYLSMGSLLRKDASFCHNSKTLNQEVILQLLKGKFKPSSYLQPHRSVLKRGSVAEEREELGKRDSPLLHPNEEALFLSFNPPGRPPRIPGPSLEEKLLFPAPMRDTPSFFIR